ncbi:MAG: hypothetical protein HW403_1105, partial [Dehalococcoidia bacterium]|nr:hypothetical protein [Dehalococcoidia bacterium]
YKYLGNNSRYFWLSVWGSWESFEAAVLDSPMGTYLREHPVRDLVSEPNVQRFYRVIDQR